MITNQHVSRGAAAQFLDEGQYDWTKPEAAELHEILVQAYSTQGRAEHHLARSGVDRAEIQMGQPIRSLWRQALEVAAMARKSRALVELARRDPTVAAYHARLDRLLSPVPRPSEPLAAASVVLPWAGNELITGAQATFLEMSFFHEGLHVAGSVARLLTQTAEGESFSGTGFLIAPDTLLTNHHVLYDDRGRPVEQVEIWFNYELDRARRPREVDRYEGDVSTIAGNAELDWAILRTARPVKASSRSLTSARPSQ